MEKTEKPVIVEKAVKKLETKYDSHVEIRFHKAKKAILPQLDAVIKINLNLNDVCKELSTKYGIDPATFKHWVQEQIASIVTVEEDEDATEETVEE